MINNVSIHTEYITLGQMIKFVGLISSGYEEKQFVISHAITVNGEKENRRGKKLRPGDQIEIDGSVYKICASSN